jgi:hypothetical protein
LSARSHGPRHRAADETDELAPLHAITHAQETPS